jgi:rhodanese-related sulfurtransferase
LNRLFPAEPEPALPEVTVVDFLREGHTGSQVIDVREPDEWAAGHMPDALLIPLGDLPARCGELDRRRPVVIVCRSGRRSLIAAEFLRAAGFPDSRSLAGGMIAWAEAGQPVVFDR